MSQTPNGDPAKPATFPGGDGGPSGRHTELIWPGKYGADGRRAEPVLSPASLRVAEMVGGGRDVSPGGRWRNRLVRGDNLHVAAALLPELRGKIDLIYIDPPFATGTDFAWGGKTSGGGRRAYRDSWPGGIDGYLAMMAPRLQRMRDLLSESGSLYVHLDAHVSHYIKAMLDELFGPGCFQREIIWRIGWVSGYKSAARNWIRNHDTILFYARTPNAFTFRKKYIPYPAGYLRRGGRRPSGKGYPMEDVWNANPFEFALSGEASLDSIQIKSFSTEKTGYPTQKNESLVRRILEVSSRPGDLVADFFAGSGTTLAVAERLGRRWIGAEVSAPAVQVARRRLLDLRVEDPAGGPERGCRPFDVATVVVPARVGATSVADDRAGRVRRILDLYGARPAEGRHVHGRKGRALVSVVGMDEPVAGAQVASAVRETREMGYRELDVLGQAWGPEFFDPAWGGGASDAGVRLRLRRIPWEVHSRDVRFPDLPRLDVDVRSAGGGMVAELRGFRARGVEAVHVEARRKGLAWAARIESWAVDWDFRGGVFRGDWYGWRGERDGRLPLETSRHVYEKACAPRILVRVVDVLGYTASRIFSVRVG